MPEETVIVGDASSRFLCRSGHNSQNYNADLYFFDAVALVFARDKDKPHGTSFFTSSSKWIEIPSYILALAHILYRNASFKNE